MTALHWYFHCVYFHVSAEFIIDISDKNPTAEGFKKALIDNGAEFSDSFMTNLLRIIQHMKPVNSNPDKNDKEQNASNPLVNKFPGLAIPNEKPPIFSSDEDSSDDEPDTKKRLTAKDMFKDDKMIVSKDKIINQAMAELEALAPSKVGTKIESPKKEDIKKRERSHSRDRKDIGKRDSSIDKKEYSRDRRKDSRSRHRSRSKNRDHRSRSRDRKKRSRSRNRYRSGDRQKRSRSRDRKRSRSHGRRSHSRDRNEKSRYGNKDEKIKYGERDDKSRYGDKDEKSRYGDRDDKSRYGNRDEKGRYGDSNEKGRNGDFGKKNRKRSPEVELKDDPECGKVCILF